MSMHSEILEQGEAVTRLVAANSGGTMDLASRLRGDVTNCVIAARGTSDNAARYAQYVWGARNRLTVALATPSLFSVYRSPPSLAGSLVVGISQSGESPDIVEVLNEARRQRRPTIAITNNTQSPIAEAADLVIDLCTGNEDAVAATKTYTTELAAVAIISKALSGHSPDTLTELSDSINQVLQREGQVAAAVEQLVDADRCVILARGYHFATAYEWALKLQETTYMLAQPFSAADFQHGPSAAVDSTVPVLIVATSGPAYQSTIDTAEALRERGAHVVAISDKPAAPADQTIVIPTTDEWLSPIVAAPAIQLHSYHLSLARGHDPNSPRGLSKVTRTR